MYLRALVAIAGVPLLGGFIPVHGLPLEEQFKQQQLEKDRVWSICYSQYKKAIYSRPEGFDFASLDEVGSSGNGEYKLMSTSKGIQGIAADIEQQANGSWKCKRGLIEKPMLLDKKYARSTPVYAPKPGCRSIGLYGVMLSQECFGKAKMIGYRVEYSTLKEEACLTPSWGFTCLYLYRKKDQEKVTKDLIGVRVQRGEQ